jgi:hypothetical protein
MRKTLKKFIPQWLLAAGANALERQRHRIYSKLPVEQVFAKIYADKEWGGEGEAGFYSGAGSHDPAIVAPYVRAVTEYLRALPSPPTIVDLGCGDFNVGKHFVDFAREYHACDIVPELQEHNRRRYPRQTLHFPCVNIVDDALPDGDIVFIRQVFQHLGNAQIAKALEKCKKYDAWIVTEHLPGGDSFHPNIDISAGCGIRGLVKSGVVLTEPPFSLRGYDSRLLCEIPYHGDVIRTTLFARTEN